MLQKYGSECRNLHWSCLTWETRAGTCHLLGYLDSMRCLAAAEVCLDAGPRFAKSRGGLFTAASFFHTSVPMHVASSLVLVGTHQTASCRGAIRWRRRHTAPESCHVFFLWRSNRSNCEIRWQSREPMLQALPRHCCRTFWQNNFWQFF